MWCTESKYLEIVQRTKTLTIYSYNDPLTINNHVSAKDNVRRMLRLLIVKRACGIWEGWTWCMEATGAGSGDNIPGIYALIYTRYMLLNFHLSSPIILGDAD